MRRYRGALVTIFALPIAQLYWLFRYSALKDTWPARIGTFVVMLPGLLFVSLLWAGIWAAAVFAAFQLVGHQP